MSKRLSWFMVAVCGAMLSFGLAFGGYAIGADQTPPVSVEQKILAAKSKAEHEELAVHYEQEAKTLQAKAEEHKEMAKAYGKSPLAEKHDFARHCNSIAQKYEAAAKDDLALAKLHRSLAKKSPQ